MHTVDKTGQQTHTCMCTFLVRKYSCVPVAKTPQTKHYISSIIVKGCYSQQMPHEYMNQQQQ